MNRLRVKEGRRRDACLSYTTLGEYVQEFTWPKGSLDVKGLFDAASSKKQYYKKRSILVYRIRNAYAHSSSCLLYR